MNFLAHYHFFKTTDNEHNLGLILPDLLHHFCQQHYPHHLIEKSNTFEGFHKGCKTHLLTDKYFHNSIHFKSLLTRFKTQLNHKVDWPRKWFFNHVLAEMLIDRIILLKAPNEAEEMYAALRRIEPIRLSEFLISIKANPDIFLPAFERFIAAAFIKQYASPFGISISLQNLYKRAGIPYEFTDKDKHIIHEELKSLQAIVEENLSPIVKELAQISDIRI
jgi:hypothetical protein